MDLPGYDLHQLKGDLEGFWSVSINKNWRVIFRFEDGAAIDVDCLRRERPALHRGSYRALEGFPPDVFAYVREHEGDRVTVLQRRPAGLGLREVLTDISDADAVLKALDGHEAVIHLAAKVNVVGPEAEYQRVNVQGTRAIVDACVMAGVRRLVFVSSPSVAHSGTSLVCRGAWRGDFVFGKSRSNQCRSRAQNWPEVSSALRLHSPKSLVRR